MIQLTINDLPVQVNEGTTILNAARQAGIDIPTLCDHPHLTPYGACRLCVVEIDGFRTLQPACTTPATNNMVVRTDTEKTKAARKFVLSMIFSDRNHFCPYCQVSGGDCELQNAAYGEGMPNWPIPPQWKPYPVDASHPYFVFEHNRCILCRRCVRACSELVGINTLGVEERGANISVIADLDVPLGESSCVSCGSCVQVCPTGALIDRRSAYLGHEEDFEFHRTICTGCSLGCGVQVATRNGIPVRIDGDWDAPVNQGVICKVGRYDPLYDVRERLTTPLLRKNGSLQPVSWEEALSAAGSHISAGKDHLAALISTRESIEALHLFKSIFSDGLNASLVTSLEGGIATGIPSRFAEECQKPFECGLEALESADSFLVFGANLTNQHEVTGFIVRRRLLQGALLILVDAPVNNLAPVANCVLSPESGRELHLLESLTAAVARLGLNKAPFQGNPITALNSSAEKCGISTDIILKAAFQFASPEKPVIIYDPARLDNPAMLHALMNLAEATGAALFNPKGGANSLAAAQYHLDQPVRLNGQETVFLALGDEDPSEELVKTLGNPKFLVVQASHASALTAAADIVLPVAGWLEQEGHYLNAGGKLQKAEHCLDAPGIDVRSSVEALSALASHLAVKVNGAWQDEIIQRPSPVQIELKAER